jgi:3-phenylpropionate/cinnamic acid dioxygenase small subunit
MAVDSGYRDVSPDPQMAEPVSFLLHHEIEQFLYHEARMLDDRRFEQWFELLADDIRYVMPTRYNRLKREADREFAAPNEAQLFDEDKESIGQRIKRLRTGMAWAEDPPSRTRHFVSNVVVRRTTNPDEFEVDCYYLLYRSRLEREVEIFAGMRNDLVRCVDTPARWQIARRRIILDQATVLARNLSFFF